jgi:hypothetical protein
MKFATHTDMIPAGYNDLLLAAQQGTITQVRISGVSYGIVADATIFPLWILFSSCSILLLGVGLTGRKLRKERHRSSPKVSKESLVGGADAAAAATAATGGTVEGDDIQYDRPVRFGHRFIRRKTSTEPKK